MEETKITAEETFNVQAEFNKWLKELTNSEKYLITDMMKEYASQQTAEKDREIEILKLCEKDSKAHYNELKNDYEAMQSQLSEMAKALEDEIMGEMDSSKFERCKKLIDAVNK